MLSYPFRIRVFAVASACLAGFVDAVAYIQLGGFFVSFMSGNSTRLGVGTAYHLRDALVAAGLISSFILGVVFGSSLGRLVDRSRRSVLMAVISALLALAAVAGFAGVSILAGMTLALAMGALNVVLEENGESRIGLTYMTGALVKTGQRLAAALFGGPRWGWTPYLLLWSALVTGAIAGATTFRLVGLNTLWLAAAAALGLAVLVGGSTRSSGAGG